MKQTILQLQAILSQYHPLLRQLSETQLNHRYAPGKWSKQQEIGHLIDSAQNNIRRFIEAQYQSTPSTIVYNQDEWVKLNAYDQFPSADLIQLWYLLNKQIIIILSNIPEERFKNISIRREPHTIEWLAADYNKHLKYHLHRILDLEAVPYP